MSLNNLQLEAEGQGERVREEVLAQTSTELHDLDKQVQDVATSKGQEVADSINVTPQLEADVAEFIRAAVNNELDEYTGEFNAEAFDKDGEAGLDQFEFKQFSQSLDTAIDQIILLDGLGAFADVHEDSATDSWYEVDKHAANGLNALTDGALDLMIGDDKDGSLAEKLLNGLDLSDAEIQEMKDKPFSLTSGESWKELGILLALELGEGVEDIIRFLINIPSAAILIPRYTALRVQLNSSDPQEAAEAEVILDELVEQNPALGLLNLLGEDGIQAVKSIAAMMTSGKQGDIALTAVSIAGLFAGGAGAVRLGARMSKMSKLESAAARVQRGAERVDDIVGGAGMGHMTGQFRNPETIKPSGADNAEHKTLTFEKDGIPIEAEARVIDLHSEEFDAHFERAPMFIKNAEVRARQIQPGDSELVETALDATFSTASEGDWIVTNPGGESYTVKNETFQNAYRAKEGEEGAFIALGVPVRVVQVSENVVFTAPWGSDQGVMAGGYVVERTDNGERYGIEEQAFLDTYEPTAPVQRFDPAEMRKNSQLEPSARQAEASKVLGRELTPEQNRAILEAHELGADGVGEYSMRELVAKRKILTEAGFTKAEANLLMDKGITGRWDRLRGKTPPSPEFQLGSEVIIPRSDGSTSVAQIAEFMPDGRVRVAWNDPQRGAMHKVVSPEQLRAVPEKPSFNVGNEIVIPRSDGSTSLATIAEVRPDGQLLVKWEDPVRGRLQKVISPESLQGLNKLEYNQPLKSLDTRLLSIGDSIAVKTASGSEYSFTVIGKSGEQTLVRWDGKVGRDGEPVEGFIGGNTRNNQLNLGEPLLIGRGNTNRLTEIQVRANQNSVDSPTPDQRIQTPRHNTGLRSVDVNDVLNSGVRLDADTVAALRIPEFQPVREVEVNGRKFYLSQRIEGGSRATVIAYTEVDGVLKTRMFYKSQSDGGWRLNSPSNNQQLSKGLIVSKEYGQNQYRHYTRETKPHEDLSSAFDEIPSSNDPNLYGKQRDVRDVYKNENNLDDYAAETQNGVALKPLVQVGRNGEGVDGGVIVGNLTVEMMRGIRYPDGFIPNFSSPPVRSYDMSHTLLSRMNAQGQPIKDIKVDVFEGRLPNGERLEWHFASDAQGRIWIEKIDTPDTSEMNSFGVQSRVNDFGVLDMKPLDYSKQVDGIPGAYRNDLGNHPDYQDITPFIAQLEPVRLYRDYLSRH